MRKFAMLFIVAVLSFGFVGCATGPKVDSPEWWAKNAPKHATVVVESVEYPVGLMGYECTEVCFIWAGKSSDKIWFSGDQRAKFRVGKKFTDLELGCCSALKDGLLYRYHLEVDGMNYAVWFFIPKTQ